MLDSYQRVESVLAAFAAGEIVVVTDDVPMAVTPEQAAAHIQLVGLVNDGKRAARPGYAVLKDGEKVGEQIGAVGKAQLAGLLDKALA